MLQKDFIPCKTRILLNEFFALAQSLSQLRQLFKLLKIE